MLAALRSQDTFEVLISRLHESHSLPVYSAIERLVEAGQAVGLDVKDLVQLLDRGRTLQELFELVEGKMEHTQEAA